MRTFAILALAMALAIPAPASAHRRGGRDDRNNAEHVSVSREQAIETARAQGVATIREVDLRDGNWKVEGYTDSGRRIEVEISAHSGEVVKRELY